MSAAILLALTLIDRRLRSLRLRRNSPASTAIPHQRKPHSFHARFVHFNDARAKRLREFLDRAGLTAARVEHMTNGSINAGLVVSWRRGESYPNHWQQHTLFVCANDRTVHPRRAPIAWPDVFGGKESVQ
jgi:hypothetical protein